MHVTMSDWVHSTVLSISTIYHSQCAGVVTVVCLTPILISRHVTQILCFIHSTFNIADSLPWPFTRCTHNWTCLKPFQQLKPTSHYPHVPKKSHQVFKAIAAWDPKLKNLESKVDQQIHALNNKAYLADIFGQADNLLLFSLFTSKGKKHRHHTVKPEPAQESKSSQISNDNGKAAAKNMQAIAQ